ncbi:MAG: hypothetical protein EOO10_19865 [Chitinophagaceae bacterium]|nr:MAG: hypothetical protein EOO10_19865 [Chitinophagaceae bacterium]
MAKTTTAPNQDNFDRAFINVLHALQKIGFCKNVAEIEKHLEFPKRTLYQVLDGSRSVPKLRRHTLLKFFTDTYHVNPRIFTNLTQPVFAGEQPTLNDVDEPYQVNTKPKGGRKNITMGDVLELERLRKEMADKEQQVKDLRRDLKRCQDLVEKLVSPAKGTAGSRTKGGQSAGQKSGKK